MRLWHIDLVKNGLLPKSQIIAQWRELNSIFKKEDKHILINYIYDYGKYHLKAYADAVIFQMNRKNIKIKSMEKYYNYFECLGVDFYNSYTPQYPEHNNEYLLSNFFNLLEKYRRGQKDFDDETFSRLYDFINKKIDLESIGIYKKIN